MEFEKAKRIFIGGIIILVCIIAGVYIYRMYHCQFPIEYVDCQDAKFFTGQGNVDIFSVRVTNRGNVGVTNIRIGYDS